MKNPDTRKSESQGVRLSTDTWPKLRAINQIQGRVWLEKAVDREYKKLHPRTISDAPKALKASKALQAKCKAENAAAVAAE